LALPTDSSDTFLREVDENLRRDQAQDFVRTYGKWLIAGVVLLLAAIGGYIYWQNQQRARAAAQSEELAKVYTDIGANRLATVPQRLNGIAAESQEVTRALALFTSAAVALEQNDRKLATAKYREIVADEDLPQAYRDGALVRATTLEFDSLPAEQVIARMQPFTKAGEPWFGSAGELTAMALVKQGKKTEAGRLFAAIAADNQVPESMRARSAQIAGTLGVDASASMPTFAQ
jgi:hypothetical protein